jgi:hypothetical protein
MQEDTVENREAKLNSQDYVHEVVDMLYEYVLAQDMKVYQKALVNANARYYGNERPRRHGPKSKK